MNGVIKKRDCEKRNSKKGFLRNPIQMFQKSFQRFLCKIHVVMICGILAMPVFAGCGREVSVLKNGAMEDSSKTEDTSDSDTEKNTEDKQVEQEHLNQENSNQEILIYVDVGGAVKIPGVYALPEGSRVFEVIAQAGGFTKDAYLKPINQAKILEDGEQIYVYTKQEAEELLAQKGLTGTNRVMSENILTEYDISSQNVNGLTGKVNLNLADKETLMTLAGIGATRADAIVQYRKEHGKFHSIEDLMQVDGIKEKTYEKIKDCITV